jgi:hypothetical protein
MLQVTDRLQVRWLPLVYSYLTKCNGPWVKGRDVPGFKVRDKDDFHT